MQKRTIIKWLRIIHRDLGYFMVGISMIYAISGMILNHMGEYDPAYKTTERTLNVEKNIHNEEMLRAICVENELPTLKRTMQIDSDHTQLLLEGGIGVYNSATGIIDYESHKRNDLIYWINRLHYSRVNGWSIIADIFALSLIFFALSGLFMIPGKRGIMGRGKWLLLLGLLVPLIYIYLQ